MMTSSLTFLDFSKVKATRSRLATAKQSIRSCGAIRHHGLSPPPSVNSRGRVRGVEVEQKLDFRGGRYPPLVCTQRSGWVFNPGYDTEAVFHSGKRMRCWRYQYFDLPSR